VQHNYAAGSYKQSGDAIKLSFMVNGVRNEGRTCATDYYRITVQRHCNRRILRSVFLSS